VTALAIATTMPNDDSQRYSRQLGLPRLGAEGQQRLAGATALIVGLGGLGAPASLYLASSGIGHLLINDFDRVDITNLPRQILFQSGDVGAYKTTVTAKRLGEINPAVNLTELNQRLTGDELAETMTNCDVVLDCTDNFATRMMINTASLRSGTPLVSGAAIRYEGQIAVFRPDRSGGPCYSCLYSEQDEDLENCAGQGILAPVAGTIGCMMATEAIKVLAGIDSEIEGKLWVYDGLAGSSRLLGIPTREDCTACN
jgi:molybdopterin/thiamine biosynthesis adenylyltransferase